jgi:hypothetical protein
MPLVASVMALAVFIRFIKYPANRAAIKHLQQLLLINEKKS